MPISNYWEPAERADGRLFVTLIGVDSRASEPNLW